MKKNIEKIVLLAIYTMMAITLITPLAVDSGFFFPFITTKVLIFRTAVELMLVFYFLLVFLNQEFQPRFNTLFILAASFTFLAFLSSWLGPDFYLSFWGDMERGEGLILWLHLLIYFLVLISVLRTHKVWMNFFNFSLVITLFLSLFALGQYFEFESFLRTTGTRVEATIGNPSFLAAYLIFHIAFALYLLSQTKHFALRVYYIFLVFLFAFIAFQTQTRGAMLGLLAGFFVLSALVLARKKQGQWFRRSVGGAVIFLIAILLIVYVNRDSEWVRNYRPLQRLSSISLQHRTTQTRLATWKSAWNGWKERFFLGYGLEHFNLVFDKNFSSVIYEDEGSQVWFDRAHNVIFDRGVTTGIGGLILYMVFLLYPVYFLLKNYLKEDKHSWLAVIFISLIAAFLIQDFFIFETITTYIILFFTFAFLSTLPRQYEFSSRIVQKPLWLVVSVISVVALYPVVNVVNIQPAKAALAIGRAQTFAGLGADFFATVKAYQTALESGTYGVPEFRIRYIEYVDNSLANVGAVVEEVKPILEFTDFVVEDFIQDRSFDAKSHLIAMRHYNFTFASLPEKKFERLDKAMSFFPKLQELTPTRPHIYYEAGFTNLYKYRNYKEQGENEKAKQAALEAEKYFQKAVEFSPTVMESYVQLLMHYFNTGEREKVEQTLQKMEGHEKTALRFQSIDYLRRMARLALSNEQYRYVAFYNQEIFNREPENADALIQVALAYAYMDERQKAIEIGEKIKEIGDEEQKAQAQIFIDDLKGGKFKIDKK